MIKPVVSIVYNTCVYVEKFRLPLIDALRRAGYQVVVIAPTDEATPRLLARGIAHRPIHMHQYGMNPLDDLRSMREIEAVLRDLCPVASLHYTIKPNVFGSLAAHRVGVPVINNIAGAGRAFSGGNPLLRRLVVALYRWSLAKSHRVCFQNGDDMAQFLAFGLVRAAQCLRIPGSGVDLKRFVATPMPSGPIRFLFVGRLLREKGIAEFLEAAASLLATDDGARMRFDVVGELEQGHGYLSRAELDRLTLPEQVRYLGTVSPERIDTLMHEASCVVLPSYYGEGVPRVLLEACASGRPIITTDNVGCREVVEDGYNGFRVPVRDCTALANAMQRFFDLSVEARAALGAAARKTAVDRFDEQQVINTYLETLAALPGKAG